jgi:hypothetical protein
MIERPVFLHQDDDVLDVAEAGAGGLLLRQGFSQVGGHQSGRRGKLRRAFQQPAACRTAGGVARVAHRMVSSVTRSLRTPDRQCNRCDSTGSAHHVKVFALARMLTGHKGS